MADPTPEELDELRQEADLADDKAARQKNIDEAVKKGWQHQPGIGWVDEKGTLRLDDIGREL